MYEGAERVENRVYHTPSKLSRDGSHEIINVNETNL